MWKCEVLEHPVAKRAEVVATRLREQPFDELSLPSLSLRRSDERACPGVGGCGAVVAPDEMVATMLAKYETLGNPWTLKFSARAWFARQRP